MRWLLDADPAIRWQVMRDLVGEQPEVVAQERARVAERGWGAALLGRQREDGAWDGAGGAPRWQATLGAMVLLKDLGLEPASERARAAVARVAERVTWGPEFGDAPFFEGEVEPCINGRVLGLGAYFGRPSERLLGRLLGEQFADGGWNCDAGGEHGTVRSSFHTTICVLEGLLAYEQAAGPTAAVTEACARGRAYLLDRRMFRRLSTGEAIRDRKGDRDWTRFTFPTTWHYDVLRGLDYLRAAGAAPDGRAREAVAIVAKRRAPDGRWPLGEPHYDPLGFAMEGGADEPSRWVTLRALRVLAWYARPAARDDRAALGGG